ncbi:MAG: N-acetylmuramoyl-L-alanine amidase [bacterium]
MLAFLVAALVPTYTICLDPGHPSENGSGAEAKGLTEMELVWDVSKRAEKLLNESSNPRFKVVMTKDSLNHKVTNRKRADIANECHADLCLRIHADSGGRSGIATYYPDRQARVQGHLGPSKDVIAKSSALAPVFHSAMVGSLGDVLPNLGCLSEQKTFIGGKQGALTGSVFSEVPVFLVELCAVDNKHDAAFAKTSNGRDAFAYALVAGVRACLNQEGSQGLRK